MFWTDQGANPKIERSTLSGEVRQAIVNNDILSPTSIVVDYLANRVFWVDSRKETVESSDFMGNNRKKVASSKGTLFYGIALYKDYIFVTDQRKKQLKIYSQRKNKNVLNFNLRSTPYSIVMYDRLSQPGNQASSACVRDYCDHTCVGQPSGLAKCLCYHGYKLQTDRRTCKKDTTFKVPQFFYSIGPAVCAFSANFADKRMNNVALDKQCFLTKRRQVVALAFDVHENMLYYAERQRKTISRVILQDGHVPHDIAGGLGRVEAMSVDWIANHLYWTDSEAKAIIVSNMDGTYQTTLIAGLQSPTGIAVDPIRSNMFWIDQRPAGGAIIERSNLDGRNRTTLKTMANARLQHITIDFTEKRLYWTDNVSGYIDSMNFDGTASRRVLIVANSSIFGVAVFRDYVIWTDQEAKNGIHVAMKSTGHKIRGVIHPGLGTAYDVISYDYQSQPLGQGNCDNHLCSQLCLPNNINYTCICAPGFKYGTDSTKCISNIIQNNFLLVTDTYQRSIYQLDLNNNKMHGLGLSKHIGNPIAVGYDNVESRVYWTDVLNKVIKRAYLNGTGEQVIRVQPQTSVIDGIAIDAVSRLLYYTDTGDNLIAVMSLDGKQHKVIINTNLDEPRGIKLDPIYGEMYWTDWGKNAKIEKAGMDGSNRHTLISMQDKGSWPNGIDVDFKGGSIYWVDARFDKIWKSNLFGQQQEVVLEEANSHYFSLAVHGDYIYYTDWKRRHIMRTSKINHAQRPEAIGPGMLRRPNDIVSVSSASSHTSRGSNQCASYNGFCSHLCIPIRGGKKCACPDGMAMGLDGRNCHRGSPSVTVHPTRETGRKPTTLSENSSGFKTPGYVSIVPPSVPGMMDGPDITIPPNTTPTSDDDTVNNSSKGYTGKSNLNLTIITGISVAGAALIVILILVTVCIIKKRTKEKPPKRQPLYMDSSNVSTLSRDTVEMSLDDTHHSGQYTSRNSIGSNDHIFAVTAAPNGIDNPTFTRAGSVISEGTTNNRSQTLNPRQSSFTTFTLSSRC